MQYVVFVDDGHGMETPGKRTPYIASLGRQIKENEFNRVVVDTLAKELERHGVAVHRTAPGDDDVPLRDRTDFANKLYWGYINKHGKENVSAVFVSVHYNAFDGKFDGNDPSGFSVHIYPGSKSGRKLAEFVLNELKEGTKQINRGIVEQNLHIVRETAMPAILTENGFMDNEREALLMIDENFQQEVALEHTKGLLKYFGINYKAQQKTEPEPLDIAGHWAEEALLKARATGAMQGFPDGTMRPNEPVTRAQLATVLDNLGLLD